MARADDYDDELDDDGGDDGDDVTAALKRCSARQGPAIGPTCRQGSRWSAPAFRQSVKHCVVVDGVFGRVLPEIGTGTGLRRRPPPG